MPSNRAKIAHAYLLQLQGYEEATAIMKNRYLYAVYALRKEKTESRESAFREMTMETNKIRKNIFKSLKDMDNAYSREVLWMSYIERKQEDEISEELQMTIKEVQDLKNIGLQNLRIPQEYLKVYYRRNEKIMRVSLFTCQNEQAPGSLERGAVILPPGGMEAGRKRE